MIRKTKTKPPAKKSLKLKSLMPTWRDITISAITILLSYLWVQLGPTEMYWRKLVWATLDKFNTHPHWAAVKVLTVECAFPKLSVHGEEGVWIWSKDMQNDQRSTFRQPSFAGNNESLISIADCDGDNMPEIVFSTPSRDYSGISLWLIDANGEVRDKISFSNRVMASINGDTTHFRLERMVMVDWSKTGFNRPVIQLVSTNDRSECVLFEVGFNQKCDAFLPVTQWKRICKRGWWVFLKVLDSNPNSQYLWAGGQGAGEEGWASLAIFKGGLPQQDNWPPVSLKNVILYRFPIDPMFRRNGVTMKTMGLDTLQMPKGVRVQIGSQEFPPRQTFSYRFQYDASFVRADLSETMWNTYRWANKSAGDPIKFTRQFYQRYMSFYQVYDGKSWTPYDSLDRFAMQDFPGWFKKE